MARQGYTTVTMPETVQKILDEFAARKQISKTALFSDAAEMYMLAADEALYLELKKKYLHVDRVRDMIADREAGGDPAAADYLFMKLGLSADASGAPLTPQAAMDLYLADQQRRGDTWFSTESLFFGMSEKRVRQYNEKIHSGLQVRILFAIHDERVDNDIAYSARILRIHSGRLPGPCPESGREPPEFAGATARIWLKLTDLRPETALRANMFQITSTGSNLKETISKAQFHFGYVSLREEA